LLVLLAAALHAGWNALVKAGDDGLTRLAFVNLGCGACGLVMLPFVAMPDPRAWPFIAASVVVHHAYYFLLVAGYRHGDLSQVYPIARGSAPLLVAVGAFVFADERLSGLGVLGVLIISAAIYSLAIDGRRGNRSPGPIGAALATGTAIAGYTIVDGLGGRAAGDVLGYIAALFLLDSLPLALMVLHLRRHSLAYTLSSNWRAGLAGGVCSGLAYGLVIWAMSLVPMTYVSALRETSVILAAWFGTRLLREPFGARRLMAAALVAAGVALLQASRSL
jgi:drug/metabolite transporter (DMT)-like permease